MATDTDIRGVQTPDAIPLPDAAVLDGSASLAEFVGLLRDQTLIGSAAAHAAQTAAEAAAEADPPPPTAYTIERRLRKLSPHGGFAGVFTSFSVGSATAPQIVERLAVTFSATAPAPVNGPRWEAILAVGPVGSASLEGAALPSEWIPVDQGFCEPDAAQGGSIIFEPPSGYFVPAGYELKVVVLPDLAACSAQWVELG